MEILMDSGGKDSSERILDDQMSDSLYFCRHLALVLLHFLLTSQTELNSLCSKNLFFATQQPIEFILGGEGMMLVLKFSVRQKDKLRTFNLLLFLGRGEKKENQQIQQSRTQLCFGKYQPGRRVNPGLCQVQTGLMQDRLPSKNKDNSELFCFMRENNFYIFI